MSKYNTEIESTLSQIIDYIGADPKYKKYAQLHTYLEWLLKNCGVCDI